VDAEASAFAVPAFVVAAVLRPGADKLMPARIGTARLLIKIVILRLVAGWICA
jgi:hypothetical protein